MHAAEIIYFLRIINAILSLFYHMVFQMLYILVYGTDINSVINSIICSLEYHLTSIAPQLPPSLNNLNKISNVPC